jgi:predicted nucleic acid-binding protein
LIVVDTSVWIDFFDHPASRHAQILKHLIDLDADLAVVDISLTEILRGIKDEKIFLSVQESLSHFPVLSAQGHDTFVFATQICRGCARRGKIISKTIDAYIAAVVIEHQAQLFHKDKDFDVIADHIPLKIYPLITHPRL